MIVLASFSIHFFSGVTYEGDIQQGPWPDAMSVCQLTHYPLTSITVQDLPRMTMCVSTPAIA
jgi:hypothetical protein